MRFFSRPLFIFPPPPFLPPFPRLPVATVDVLLSKCQIRLAKIAYLRAEGWAQANTRFSCAASGTICQQKAALGGQVRAGKAFVKPAAAVRVSHHPFLLSFCFSAGRAFPAPNRKTTGEKHAKTPPSGRKFPGMRSRIRRSADKRATRCGEKKCFLRSAARALAENTRRFCGKNRQNLQIDVDKCMENPSPTEGFEKVPVRKNTEKFAF